MNAFASSSIDRVSISVFEIPTDQPEQDGTLSWQKTTLVVVEPSAGGMTSLGYTYADAATAKLIETTLAPLLLGANVFATAAAHAQLTRAIRNSGGDGITAMAISALDLALWDLKARLLAVPLGSLLGGARKRVPVYGSGGFTSYDRKTLQHQLARWVEQGISKVKMKVGAHPERDLERVRQARAAIGEQCELYVDANGAHGVKEALRQAERFARFNVTWFEEPVSSDDLEGLRFVRERAPAGMNVTAGEYGYRLGYFLNMLQARAVDVLQLDATRCGGVTGFLRAAHLAQAFQIPLSTHCAPALHLHLACAIETVQHLEYFHDHVRIESMLLGSRPPENGALEIDDSQPGFALRLDVSRAAQYRAGHVEIRAH